MNTLQQAESRSPITVGAGIVVLLAVILKYLLDRPKPLDLPNAPGEMADGSYMSMNMAGVVKVCLKEQILWTMMDIEILKRTSSIPIKLSSSQRRA